MCFCVHGASPCADHELGQLPDSCVARRPAGGTGGWETALTNTLSPGDTMMVDDTMMEDTMMVDDTMMEGEMMEDTTSTM